MEKLVMRPHYMDALNQYLGTSQVKVLSGVRRCGKSSLLKMLNMQLLSSNVPAKNILYLRCDSSDVPLNADVEWLESEVHSSMASSESTHKTYLLLDEVQEIAGWEKVVRRLHTDRLADVYITGSNASLLSSDLATYLSGRYVEIPVFPLSFSEYIQFLKELDAPMAESEDDEFETYLRYGGMPGLFELKDRNQAQISRELQSIHDTVILNDVAKRFDIRDIELLEKLVRFAFSTSGNLFSTRSIVNALQSSGRKAYSETIDSYIRALAKAFLLYPCEQEGLLGKNVLRPLRKLYAPDTGLRNLEIGFKRQDIGFQLESVVRMELARKGYSVHVGALNCGEIDFVATKNDERLYIQVAQSISDENVLRREITPLLATGDAFPKTILTTDRIGLGTTPEGVAIENLAEWLLKS